MYPNVRAVGNKVSGTAAIGFFILAWAPCTSSNGYYVDNNLKDFTGLSADLHFIAGADNNIWIGPYNSLVDKGTGNQFHPSPCLTTNKLRTGSYWERYLDLKWEPFSIYPVLGTSRVGDITL